MMQSPGDEDYEEEKEFIDHMTKTFDRTYNIEEAKKHCKEFVVLHDKNDYAVQMTWAEDLATKLGVSLHVFEAQETHACGKTEPVILEHAIKNNNLKITVFTTRPDTLFGVTAIVLAPENASVDAYIPQEYRTAVEEYRKATSQKSEVERQQEAEQKTGVFS